MWKRVYARIREAARRRPRRQDFRGLATGCISLLAAYPAAMLWMAFGPFAVYPPKGYIDPWFYTGYFSNFTYLLSRGGITYYVSRLPWILPGRLAFGIAGAQAGSLLLSAGVVTLGAVSLYWIVRWHYGGVPAALAAIAWCTNPYVMASACWQYPDGPVLAYAMAGLALYLRPTGNRRWNSFWAAALLVVAGATNMSGGLMILSILAVPLWRSLRSWKEFLKETACSVAGAGAAAWVLSRISQAVLGSPHFLQPQINQTLYAMHTPGYLAGMWGTGPGFLVGAVRLFPPVFLLVFGPALLIAVRKPAAAAWPVYLSLCICLALYAVEEFAMHGVALRVHYHSSYMMVVVMAFAGVAMGELWTRSPGRGRGALISAGALGAGAITLSLVFNTLALPPPGGHTWVRLALLGVAGVVLAMLARRPKLPVQVLTIALVLAILFLGPALDWNSTGYVWTGVKFPHGSNLTFERQCRRLPALDGAGEFRRVARGGVARSGVLVGQGRAAYRVLHLRRGAVYVRAFRHGKGVAHRRHGSDAVLFSVHQDHRAPQRESGTHRRGYSTDGRSRHRGGERAANRHGIRRTAVRPGHAGRDRQLAAALRPGYSYLSASMGLMLAAFIAG